jgi:hypothetical protein
MENWKSRKQKVRECRKLFKKFIFELKKLYNTRRDKALKANLDIFEDLALTVFNSVMCNDKEVALGLCGLNTSDESDFDRTPTKIEKIKNKYCYILEEFIKKIELHLVNKKVL